MYRLPTDLPRYTFGFVWGHGLCVACQRWSVLVHISHMNGVAGGIRLPEDVTLSAEWLTSAEVPLELRYLRFLENCRMLRQLTLVSVASCNSQSETRILGLSWLHLETCCHDSKDCLRKGRRWCS